MHKYVTGTTLIGLLYGYSCTAPAALAHERPVSRLKSTSTEATQASQLASTI